MELTPLTPGQQAAIAAFVSSRRIEAVGRFLKVVFNAPPGDRAARRFDQLRRARNSNRYEATPVGAVQAEQAKTVARELITAAQALGVGQ